ncbi:hypothetical protein K438DRAFT_1954281 [Mycena galopus ATCC 62051]|nr:hypothetical protein K438DRAFT_1954281 [Mycena galopus ATCC 62051]
MHHWFAYIFASEPTLLAAHAHALAKQVHKHYLPYLEHFEPDSDADAVDQPAKFTLIRRRTIKAMFNAAAQRLKGATDSDHFAMLCFTCLARPLLAARFSEHATEHPPSLYFTTTAGATLNRKHPDHPDAGHPYKSQLQYQEGGSANGTGEQAAGGRVIVTSEYASTSVVIMKDPTL